LLRAALLALCLLLSHAATAHAKAGPFPPPPDAAEWRAGPTGSRAAPRLAADPAVPAPSGAASLRLDFAAPGAGARDDAGLACVVRSVRVSPNIQTDLSGSAGLEFSLRADRPLVGRLTVRSSNVETGIGTDRHYGSLVVGTTWRTHRVTYRTMTPDPGWDARAAAAEGEVIVPGDRLLRPDNVEEIRICVEAGRLDAPGALWIGDVRFFKK
jgi:hypothetical protein